MKKIMFSDQYGLTKAVLEGRKTMTRRVCKEYKTGTEILAREVLSWRYYPEENLVEFVMKDGSIKVCKPPYRDGEVVAVAQAYKDTGLFDIYRGPEDTKGWSNKMFVRPDLMPHQIKITGVRIERLQDITNEDCLKEGIGYNNEVGFENGCYYFNDYEGFKTPKSAFAALINRPGVGRKGLWEDDPMVFAYEFKLEK